MINPELIVIYPHYTANKIYFNHFSIQVLKLSGLSSTSRYSETGKGSRTSLDLSPAAYEKLLLCQVLERDK